MGIKKYLSWEDLYKLLDDLHEKIKDIGFTHVTGVPRGGSILAILYSHRYGLKYQHEPSNELYLLVLDDIADSGSTLQGWRKHYDAVSFATIHYKEGSVYKPEYYAEKIDKYHSWIVYPWERKDSKDIQDYLEN